MRARASLNATSGVMFRALSRSAGSPAAARAYIQPVFKTAQVFFWLSGPLALAATLLVAEPFLPCDERHAGWRTTSPVLAVLQPVGCWCLQQHWQLFPPLKLIFPDLFHPECLPHTPCFVARSTAIAATAHPPRRPPSSHACHHCTSSPVCMFLFPSSVCRVLCCRCTGALSCLGPRFPLPP